VAEELLGHDHEGDVGDRHLLPLDEPEQDVERPLEGGQAKLVPLVEGDRGSAVHDLHSVRIPVSRDESYRDP
jgi:hypothetical protein